MSTQIFPPMKFFYLLFSKVRWWLRECFISTAQFKILWYLEYSARSHLRLCSVSCTYSGNRQIFVLCLWNTCRIWQLNHLHHCHSSTSSHNFTCTIAIVCFHFCSSTPIYFEISNQSNLLETNQIVSLW